MNWLNQENLTEEIDLLQKELSTNQHIKSLIEQFQLSERRESKTELPKTDLIEAEKLKQFSQDEMVQSKPVPPELIERLDEIIKLLQEFKNSQSSIKSEVEVSDYEQKKKDEYFFGYTPEAPSDVS